MHDTEKSCFDPLVESHDLTQFKRQSEKETSPSYIILKAEHKATEQVVGLSL